ncbi:MAG: SMP-30/gluconolactonase/LRE family protein [Ostreibacterium sp.]
MSDFHIDDEDFELILLADSQVVKHCTGAQWSEGPVYVAGEDLVFWSDIPNNRLVAYQTDKGFHEWQNPSHFSNGHTLDLQGRIINCEHGRRCISRSVWGGKTEILVDRWDGKRLNSPNDVVVKSDGTIWFSDPRYGILSNAEGYKAESEIGEDYVYRFDPQTQQLTLVVTDVIRPNGLAFSPDESMLYVTDTSASHDANGRHEVRCYDVDETGHGLLEGSGRVFAVVNPGLPDGFRLDNEGRLYVSSDDSIQVYHPDGRRLGKILIPEKVANCTFGGPNYDILYIVASTSLYSIKLGARAAVRRAVNLSL